MHSGPLLVIKVVLSPRPERDLSSGPFCAGALGWTLLPFAQINTHKCSMCFFCRRVSLSHLFSPKNCLGAFKCHFIHGVERGVAEQLLLPRGGSPEVATGEESWG